jgi:hypothetical protein
MTSSLVAESSPCSAKAQSDSLRGQINLQGCQDRLIPWCIDHAKPCQASKSAGSEYSPTVQAVMKLTEGYHRWALALPT